MRKDRRCGALLSAPSAVPFRRGLLAWTFAAIVACGPEVEQSRLDPELAAMSGLDGDEVVRTIALGGRRAEETVQPLELVIAPGEIVEFVTVDRRIHTLVFPVDSLEPGLWRFLETTGQDASPPLVGQGSRFVVTFKNAPAGRYPFVSRGYGEEAGGIIIVRENH